MIVYCQINRAAIEADQREHLLQFCRSWTEQIEIETPCTWYCRLPEHFAPAEFGAQFLTRLKQNYLAGIWGAGASKIIAKLAALTRANTYIPGSESSAFLAGLSLNLLDLPQTSQLNKLGIDTFGALAQVPLKSLRLQFGSDAEMLAKIARGQDPKPFTPDKPIKIHWEFDFLTDPEIASPVGQPQLELFLRQGLTAVAEQLRSRRLLAAKIRLDWRQNGTNFTAIRRFDPPTAEQDVFYRSLLVAIPNEPIDQIQISGLDLAPHLHKQLDIFGENPTSRKIVSLKSQLSSVLVQLKPSRREKILAMWEQSYL
ncbi:MAG: hypothetical protein ACE3NC_04890 [Candidatus Wallacebacter cryptica]|jgi:hypothetical protein|nr:hypothetical protein [Bacillota bacterium]